MFDFNPDDYRLGEEEYEAVYEWIDREKDSLPSPLKEALLKLLNGEMHRRMERTSQDKQ
jgi:hypothetical protein